MKILEFGLPSNFPDEAVPYEAALFCSEVDGLELPQAIQRAKDAGYEPIVKKAWRFGENVWHFGLTVQEVEIPLMVKLDLA